MVVRISDLIEQCREKQRDWHGMRGEDTQLSLLTGKEIRGTLGESSNRGGQMLPPIVNSDPGDETDHVEVSWDFNGTDNT